MILQNIDYKNMEKITGGSSTLAGVALIVTAVIIFLSGVINGYTNPEKCGAK